MSFALSAIGLSVTLGRCGTTVAAALVAVFGVLAVALVRLLLDARLPCRISFAL